MPLEINHHTVPHLKGLNSVLETSTRHGHGSTFTRGCILEALKIKMAKIKKVAQRAEFCVRASPPPTSRRGLTAPSVPQHSSRAGVTCTHLPHAAPHGAAHGVLDGDDPRRTHPENISSQRLFAQRSSGCARSTLSEFHGIMLHMRLVLEIRDIHSSQVTSAHV